MGGFHCLMLLLGVQMIYEANNGLKLNVGVRCQELGLLTSAEIKCFGLIQSRASLLLLMRFYYHISDAA